MTTRPLLFPALTRRAALLAAAVCLLFAAPLATAAPEYTSLAGAKAAGFQKWLDDAKDQGYSPWYVNGYTVGDHAEYAGIALKDPKGLPYEARCDMTLEDFQQWCDGLHDKGNRPRSISGYQAGKGPRFAGAWIKDDWAAKHPGKITYNQGQKDFEATLSAMRRDGMEPACVGAYQGSDGAVRYTSIFGDRAGSKWSFHYAMTADEYQTVLDGWMTHGFRPLCIQAYDTPDGLRYLGAAENMASETRQWQEHHDISGDQYQKEFDKLGAEGWQPWCICGYRDGGAVHFAAVWAKKK